MPTRYGFAAGRGGDVVLRLDDDERALLRSLAEQVSAFVAPEPHDDDVDPLEQLVGIEPTAERPIDPALARLLPDAFTDDPEASGEFRRYTERGLREVKLANAELVVAALGGPEGTELASGDIDIPDAEVGAWLALLTDIRLALGVRLEITDDGPEDLAELPDDDPRLPTYHVYDWLTYLQDSLVRLRLGAMPDDGDGPPTEAEGSDG